MNFLDNIGISELLIIFLLILLVVGPERLPEMGRKLAKFLRDVRKMYENATRDLDPEIGALQRTVKEVVDTTREIASIPRDAMRTLTQVVTQDAPEAKPAVAGPPPASTSPGAAASASQDGVSGTPSVGQTPAPAPLQDTVGRAADSEERGDTPEAKESPSADLPDQGAQLDG